MSPDQREEEILASLTEAQRDLDPLRDALATQIPDNGAEALAERLEAADAERVPARAVVEAARALLNFYDETNLGKLYDALAAYDRAERRAWEDREMRRPHTLDRP